MKKFILYLLRWQLSTPILAVVIAIFISYGVTIATVIANFVGGCIFFWIDKMIFKRKLKRPKWEIEWTNCYECGNVTKCFRLVESKYYDRIDDEKPQFRCDTCSDIKTEELKKKGVWV